MNQAPRLVSIAAPGQPQRSPPQPHIAEPCPKCTSLILSAPAAIAYPDLPLFLIPAAACGAGWHPAGRLLTGLCRQVPFHSLAVNCLPSRNRRARHSELFFSRLCHQREPPQSNRKATTGSIRAARCAGIQHASTATPNNIPAAPANVTRYVGVTPYSKVDISRVIPTAPPSPITIPTQASKRPCRSTSPRTSLYTAPIAIR